MIAFNAHVLHNRLKLILFLIWVGCTLVARRMPFNGLGQGLQSHWDRRIASLGFVVESLN